MKKITILIMTVILATVLTIVQINIVRNATAEEERILVVMFNRSAESYDLVTEDMLDVISVPLSLLPSGYSTDKNELNGKFLTRPVYEGEIALLQSVAVENPKDIGKLHKDRQDNVFVSIKPDAERTVAWQILPEQKVDLLFIPQRGDGIASFRLENLRIAAIIDENFMLMDCTDDQLHDCKPVYLILEVTFKEAELIAKAKQSGSLEVIGKE